MITKNTILLSVLIAALFSGCAQSVEEKQLVKRDKNITIRIEAQVYPSVRQNILAPIDGVVEKIHAENGSFVHNGDLLYQFDTKSIQLDIAKLKHEIRLIKKRLAMMSRDRQETKQSDETMHYNAKKYLQKIVRLHAEGYATESELSAARKQYYDTVNAKRAKMFSNEEGSDNQLIALEEKKALLQKALYQMAMSSVKSQYDGYLIGSTLKAGSNIGRSSMMASVINIDSIILKAGLAPGLYPFVKEGQKVKIDFIVTPPYSIEADVSRIIPVIDPTFGRMIVEIELKNSNYILQDGMKALVTIGLNEEHQKIVKEHFIDKKGQTIVQVRSDLK